jgi:hypothetical protein
MQNMLNQLKSKTTWGSILIALSFVPQLKEISEYLVAAGVALGGAGVAHKLDKIKEAAQPTYDSPPPQPPKSQPGMLREGNGF